MDVSIKLNRNFIIAYNKMQKKYGPELARLNGFGEGQLSYTDFIDNFIDKNTVADASIDGNANVGHKDIVSLQNEMSKPHSKLLAFNKIYYELDKKYGRKTAEAFLEQEWIGNYYLHDAYSSTFVPYCYFGKELVQVKYKNKIHVISFIDLYELIQEQEIFDSIINSYCKYPEDLFVRDMVNGQLVWSKLTRILYHNNDKPMRFIKLSNGLSQITTEDHPWITNTGDVEANLVNKNHTVQTYNYIEFTNSVHEIDSFILDNDLGWVTGMILSEGITQPSKLTICQQLDREESAKIVRILTAKNIPYSISESDNRIHILSCPYQHWVLSFLLGKTSEHKKLPSTYYEYSHQFLDGVIAGMIDGDGTIDGYKHRHCQIRITSRELLNQLSLYLQFKNIFTTDRIPFLYQGTNSCKSNLTMYGIGFSLTEETYFAQINSIKIKNKYEPLLRKGNFKNKKYDYSYGENTCIENVMTEDCSVVYDITTETGHFLCNNILSHNCYAYDIEELINKGLYFIDEFNAEPPKHLVTFTDFVGEFVSWTCNRSSGAVGLPSFLIYSYYFWKKDVEENYTNNPARYRDQEFQRIIYKLNQPYLRGGIQSAFTNFSIFDREYMIALFGGKEYPDGTPIMAYIDELIEYEKAFMNVLSEVRSHNMMTFPVMSMSLLRKDGKFVDEEFARWCSKHNMQWGDSNFFISEDVTSLSNCCRLISDIKDLGYFNSLGGTALEVGSVKVNTINLARIAYDTINTTDYLMTLKDRVKLCLRTLHIVRGIIKRNTEKGLLPNYTKGIMHLENQYNTIGIIGIYEALQKFGMVEYDEFGNAFYTDAGKDFVKSIFAIIKKTKDEFAKDKDYMVNIEQIPGERAASVLMQKDKLFYPNEKYELPLYGNQWYPLGVHTTLQEKIEVSAMFDKACNGGSIAHINLDAPLQDEETAWNLLNYIADKGVTYFAFNLKINACKHNHGFYGETCPICGEPVETTYQRIVGFLTPTKTYSKERKAEFELRTWFDASKKH